MRRNRIKTRKKDKSGKSSKLMVLSFVVLLPVLAISIGFLGTKYIIMPMFFSKSAYVENHEVKENQDKTVKLNELLKKAQKEKEKDTTQESSSEVTNIDHQAEKKGYTFELPPISIYSVQVGSFNDMSHANNLVNELNNKELKGYIVKSQDRYKVIAMSFLDRKNAEKYKEEIGDKYSDSFIFTINMPIKNIKYSESGKEYSKLVSSQIDQLQDFYKEYDQFLVSNDLSTVDKNKIVEFINSQISKLENIEKSINQASPSDDFLSLNNNLKNIVNNSKAKLENLKALDVSDRKALLEIYMESLNKYPSIS